MFPHFLPPDRVAVFKPVVRRHLAARQLVRVLELARGKKDPPFPSVDDGVPCCRVSVRERTRDGWTKEELERAGAMAFTMGKPWRHQIRARAVNITWRGSRFTE